MRENKTYTILEIFLKQSVKLSKEADIGNKAKAT